MDKFESKSVKKRALANSDIKNAIGDAKQLDGATRTSSMYRLSAEQMACVSGGATAQIAGMMPAIQAPVVIAPIAGMMPTIKPIIRPIAIVGMRPVSPKVPLVVKVVK